MHRGRVVGGGAEAVQDKGRTGGAGWHGSGGQGHLVPQPCLPCRDTFKLGQEEGAPPSLLCHGLRAHWPLLF